MFPDVSYSAYMSPRRVAKTLPTEWVRQGATLRALREKSGLKVSEMANAIPISYSHLSNIEAGRKPLTPELLAKAAHVLDVPQMAIAKPHLLDREDVA